MSVEQRVLVLELVHTLVSTSITDLQSMGPDFVFGYIQIIDGEKDPRCLMLVFTTTPIVARSFDVTRFAEDLFDVTSCYFPITFTPPPNDPHGITKEGLIEGLRESMASNVLFAPFCMELLMDKVTSPVNATKAQCFLTLAACAAS